ncbi:MAG TPA: bifunctional diguanylate cyclase/phosphodiesterase [Gemmatimonadaceae bacterium]|nr:bifunctional diguanylate cyclase/phosphodiesterase [Gemmatimonadaceae bacterium]
MNAPHLSVGDITGRLHGYLAGAATALRRLLPSVARPGARLGDVFEHSLIGIAVLDESAMVLDTNAAFGGFLGVPGGELPGRSLTDFAPPEHAHVIATILQEVAGGTRANAGREVRFVRADGTMAWGSLTVWRVVSRRRVRLLAMVHDVTERKSLEAELFHKAFHDALTGLPNRALFRQNIEHALRRTSRQPNSIAVILVDLDNLKAINDTQGNSAGDRLLKLVAARLLNATRGCDTVARIGGDEFAVLLESGGTDDGADTVASRVVKALQRPFEFEDCPATTLSASMGIATFQGSEGIDELLRNAGVALDSAKRQARGRWLRYDPAMHAAIVDRVTLEADLHRAIEHGELRVVYQPIVDLETKRLAGVEALARWSHPGRGPVGPTTFIPVAEESGFIHTLGPWVLREACRQGALWNGRRRGRPLTVTVNLSGLQLVHDALPSQVEAALRESQLAPESLVLEITESAIMRTMEPTLKRLNRLKRLGVRLAIDDFGTGYSSLSYLQQFPVDILKIDRSFIEGLMRGPNELALVRTIVSLARILGLRTVAEGVEDERQQKQLAALGCDAAQGFLFGRPMSAREIEPLIEAGVAPLRRRTKGARGPAPSLVRR